MVAAEILIMKNQEDETFLQGLPKLLIVCLVGIGAMAVVYFFVGNYNIAGGVGLASIIATLIWMSNRE